MIDAGKLRHLPMLQRFTTTVDPVTGDRDKQWVDVKKVWASIEPLSARAFIAAAGVETLDAFDARDLVLDDLRDA